ncbi:MAG: MFS transporter [Alphaproteobacteria bacterium]|nr:MFS transporter [Alphaproteobacteria bacterium]
MTTATKPTQEIEPPYPSAAYSWYVVVVLMLAYVFAFLDRQILSLLVGPIKRDLNITDTEMSLILGLAFAVFYTLLGIPVGRLADRANRRAIIAWGIAIWSVMTAVCGLAKSYGQLFLARVGVGVGEATLQPCASSLIADYFPRGKRGLAYGVYAWGLGLGGGLSFVLGGQVIAAAAEAGTIILPIVGEVRPWQTVFFVIGLPGLLVALLMLTIAEPPRRDRVAGSDEPVPFGEVVAYLRQRWRTYGSHFLGLSVMTIIGNAFIAWLPTVFIRTHGWSIAEVSLWYGLILGIGGPAGVTISGWLGDKLYRQGYKDGHMRVALIGIAMLVPVAIVAPLIPNPSIAMALMIIHAIGSGMPTAAGPTALMMIAPNKMRAQITAVYWFVISSLGLTLGPTSVALITDYVLKDENAIRYSLSLVSAVSGLLVTGAVVFCLKHYRATIEETEKQIVSRG